ncbi:RlpA-like double-psi beta-barrel-protein domain-containing protein-containing protein [Mycena latifolia]|nr:RlpA-like double-psi beta-barrel-protein domain-containing protein-containing protein [Mycena latifolia]
MFNILSLFVLLLPAARALAQNLTLPDNFKRGTGDRFSNYYAGESEGACGWWNTDSEFVVALTHLEWDNGANCGREVHISWQGKSTTAKIVDECMECPWDALDFSQSLFSFFVGEGNNEEVGYIYGDWSYTDGSGSGGGDDDTTTTTTKKLVTTSTKHTTSTTSTSTTTSKTSITTSNTISRTSTTSAGASTSASTSTTSTSASAASTPSATGPQNLADFSQALLFLGSLVVAAQGAE